MAQKKNVSENVVRYIVARDTWEKPNKIRADVYFSSDRMASKETNETRARRK